MTRYLLDTDLCVSCLRRQSWALEALGSIPPTAVAVASLTVGELALGAQLSGAFDREMAKVEAFLGPIELLPFGRDEAILWAAIEAKLRKAGNRIEAEDGIIAATALARGMTLVSGNARHFDRVKGLKAWTGSSIRRSGRLRPDSEQPSWPVAPVGSWALHTRDVYPCRMVRTRGARAHGARRPEVCGERPTLIDDDEGLNHRTDPSLERAPQGSLDPSRPTATADWPSSPR